jgi:hypothetical protein
VISTGIARRAGVWSGTRPSAFQYHSPTRPSPRIRYSVPTEYSLLSCLVCEVAMTLIFLFVIMGATDKRVPAGFAPIPIGLVLTLIHLISILVTNTSVNPARSACRSSTPGPREPRRNGLPRRFAALLTSSRCQPYDGCVGWQLRKVREQWSSGRFQGFRYAQPPPSQGINLFFGF